jgi:hypothetical protein
MIEKLYRCPICGKIVNNVEILDACSSGGMPYCDCRYSAIDENGEIWYPREYTEYKLIGLDLRGRERPKKEVKQ